MPAITNRESLEVWLQDKPLEVAVAFAARAALRVAPALVQEVHDDEAIADSPAIVILRSFRAMQAAYLVARWPRQPPDIRYLRALAAHDDRSASARAVFAASAAGMAAITASAAGGSDGGKVIIGACNTTHLAVTAASFMLTSAPRAASRQNAAA